MAEEGISGTAGAGAGGGASAAVAEATASAAAVSGFDVSFVSEEKLSVTLQRDGTLEALDIKGILSLTAMQATGSRVQAQLERGSAAGFQFQTHPNVDKPSFNSSNLLALKSADKVFPVGKSIGVVRWRMPTASESLVPFTVNCWAEEMGDGSVTVTAEYELANKALELLNVQIAIPLGTTAAPDIDTCDGVTTQQGDTLLWRVDLVNAASSSGNLEFTIAGDDADAFFPIHINFDSQTTVCPVDVHGVVSAETGDALRFGMEKRLVVDKFTIV
jgi:hypothetical protein